VQALKSALQAHHADLAAHLAGTRGDVAAVLQVAIRLENAHRTNHEATQRAFAQQTTTIQSALAAAAQRHLWSTVIVGASIVMLALTVILL
jgi:hypothetical protein